MVLSFSGCSDVGNLYEASIKSATETNLRHDGAVSYNYTTAKDQGTNQVVSFARLTDGSLVNEIALNLSLNLKTNELWCPKMESLKGFI